MECNRCNRTLRWDEEQRLVMIDGVGNTYCCPNCQAEVRGEPVPVPNTYPPGTKIPKVGDGGFRHDMPICGLCRRALVYGQERGTDMRIRPEMLEDGDTVEPGGYCVCDECLNQWRPRIVRYLQSLCRTCNTLYCQDPDHVRHLPPIVNDRTVGHNMLL